MRFFWDTLYRVFILISTINLNIFSNFLPKTLIDHSFESSMFAILYKTKINLSSSFLFQTRMFDVTYPFLAPITIIMSIVSAMQVKMCFVAEEKMFYEIRVVFLWKLPKIGPPKMPFKALKPILKARLGLDSPI